MDALVVDDSRATRTFLRKRLEALGFGVVEAGDGTEALDRLGAAGEIAVALVDWNMPQMDGLELVKAMRADRRYTEIPVMMITAESDPANMARALIAGADEYAVKPIDEAGLTSKLELLGVLGGGS